MVKNKVIALLLATAMLMGSLSGCGSVSEQRSQNATEEVAEDTADKTSDASATDNSATDNSVTDAGATDASVSNVDKLVEELSLPAVGDAISGFIVKKITDYPWRNGVLVEMEYEKTGTPLLFLANEDEDKAFNAAYLTRANDNKGIPHIFEHVTLAGSTEYPNASLWQTIRGGTYNTFMNASTYTEATNYTFSSLSDEELVAIARFYLSGLSDPLALKDSNPLGREAYRYQLYDADDDISVTGAVYNEMESANSQISEITCESLQSSLYPGSYMSYNIGGVRDDITTVTLEELQTYYDTYYHPSNMVISLYGNVDYVPFLAFLDKEYLSKYDKKEVNIEDVNYKPWEGYREDVIDFPVEEGSEVKDRSETVYAITLPGISDYDLALIVSIGEMICKEGSSLSKRIEKEYPSCTLEVYYDRYIDVPVWGFQLNNSNEGDEKTIRSIINEELEKVVTDGFDQDTVDAFVNNMEAEILINADAHGGTDELVEMCNYWATHGKSTDAYLEYLEGRQSFGKANEEGRLKELVTEYILNAKTSVALSVVPRPGLYEEEWAEHEQILRDKKADMSEEEIQELIDNTLAFDEWNRQDAENVDISEFVVVDVEDLDVSFEKPELTQSQEGNVSIYSCDLGDVGYVKSGAVLSADCVPADKIYDFKIAAALLGNLATKNYDDTQLTISMDKDLYKSSFSSYIYHDWLTGKPHMTLTYDFTVLSRNIGKSAEYFDEIMNSTDFTDVDRIKYIINAEYNSVKSTLQEEPEPLSFISRYNMALTNGHYKIDYYTRGFEYLAYLKELTQMSDEDIESKMADIRDVIDIVKNQNDVIFYAYGDGEALDASKESILNVIAGFSDEKLTKTDFASELPELEKVKKIAVITNDSATYNGVISSAAAQVSPCDGISETAIQYIQNNILIPAFRYDIGAYYGFSLYDSNNKQLYVMSYRDTNVNKSFEFIDTLPDTIRNYKVIDEDLEAAKLGIYSVYAYPATDESMVRDEKYNSISNKGSYTDELNTVLKEIKGVTTKDIYDFADTYQTLVEDGLRFSYGNGSKIKEAGGYDLIIEDLVK